MTGRGVIVAVASVVTKVEVTVGRVVVVVVVTVWVWMDKYDEQKGVAWPCCSMAVMTFVTRRHSRGSKGLEPNWGMGSAATSAKTGSKAIPRTRRKPIPECYGEVRIAMKMFGSSRK